MSQQTTQWLLAFHIFGFMAWSATLTAALHTMRVHGTFGRDGHAGFVRLEKGLGIAMDGSALFAIAFGLSLLLSDLEVHMSQGYMHVKLTAVAALAVVHVMARLRIRRLRGGEVPRLRPWWIPITYGLLFLVVFAIVVGPFLGA